MVGGRWCVRIALTHTWNNYGFKSIAHSSSFCCYFLFCDSRQPFITQTHTHRHSVKSNWPPASLACSLTTHNAYTKGCYELNFFCTIMKIKTYKHETMKRLKLSHFSINGFEFCSRSRSNNDNDDSSQTPCGWWSTAIIKKPRSPLNI